MSFQEQETGAEINIAGIVIPSLLGLEVAIILSFTIFIILMVKRRNEINESKKEPKKKNKKVKNCNLKKAGQTKKKVTKTNAGKSVKTKSVTTKKINVKPANKNH